MMVATHSTQATTRHAAPWRRRVLGGAVAALAIGLSLGLWQAHSYGGRMARSSAATTREPVSGIAVAQQARPMGGYAEFVQAQQLRQSVGRADPGRPVGALLKRCSCGRPPR
jgi:hypothetical protein